MRSSKTCVFPGSFDPLTRGHVDIVERALGIFDCVIVAVMSNPSKQTMLFSVEERLAMISEEFERCHGRVKVMSFSGLLVKFLQDVESRVVLRGLRAISDFDYEAQMALMNKQLDSEVETLFMMAREENSYISSTLLKQIAPLGADVSRLVTDVVKTWVEKKVKIDGK